MAIRMRNNREQDSVCCECGEHRKDVLEMFDICIGGHISTICDECNEALFYKTLAGVCNRNARVKTPHDMQILRRRSEKSYKARWQLRQEREKQKGESK